jgi:hypothetical protein
MRNALPGHRWYTLPPAGTQLDEEMLRHRSLFQPNSIFGTYAQQGMRKLVAYWPLNDANSARGIPDIVSKGFKHGATLGSGASLVGGLYGQAVRLDGTSNGYIAVANSAEFDLDTQSVWFWFKTNQSANPIALLSRHDTNSSNGYLFWIDSNAIKLLLKGSGIDALTLTGPSVRDGAWHMAGAVIRSDSSFRECRLYVDGVLVASDSTVQPMNFNSQVTRWGKSIDSFWTGFNGDIIPGGIFNTELSFADFQQLYFEPFCLFKPPTVRSYTRIISSEVLDSLSSALSVGSTFLSTEFPDSFSSPISVGGDFQTATIESPILVGSLYDFAVAIVDEFSSAISVGSTFDIEPGFSSAISVGSTFESDATINLVEGILVGSVFDGNSGALASNRYRF